MPVVEAVPAPAASNALSPLPVSPLPLSSSAPAGPRLSPELIAVLIARGEALLASGDVTAARLMYSRAADSDSAEGAIAMGMTFDPKVLSQIGVLGPQADPQHAISWYQRAAALGSSEARRLLIQLRGGGD
jgi:TPR repeat protein